MPDDDKEVTEQVEEQEEQSSAAFEEEEDGKATPKEKEPKEETEEVELKEGEPEKEETTKEKEDETPKTAKELIEARLEQIEDEPAPVVTPEPSKEVTPKVEEKPTAPDVNQFIDLIKDDDLPESVKSGDQEFNLKDYSANYPDEMATIKVVAGIIAQKTIEKALGTAAKGEDVATLRNEIAQLHFDRDMTQLTDEDGELKHPDYHNIVYGPGREAFREWVKGKGKKVIAMASRNSVEDADLLLTYYKEDTAKAKVKTGKKKAQEEKDAYDAIHEDTGKGKAVRTRARAKETNADPESEAQAAFLEED
jgi:hypothetical protein